MSTRARLLYFTLVLYCLASIVSFLGAHWWGFELLSHFRPHLMIAGVLFAICLAMRLRAVPALIAAVFAGLQLIPVLPYWFDPSAIAARSAAQPGTGLRFSVLNLQRGKANSARISRFVLDYRPDFVVITEFSEPPLGMFTDLRDAYPHRAGSPVAGIGELLLLSRHPIQSVQWHYPAGPALPVLEVIVCPGASCLTLITMHAKWPFSRGGADQAAMLEVAARRAAARRDGRLVVFGDLNTTLYAPSFAALLKAGRLVDAARGYRSRPTWLSRIPLLGLAIDHVLVGSAFTPHDARVLPGLGVDHYPLVVDVVEAAGRPSIELALPPAEPAAPVSGGVLEPYGS